MSIEQWTTPTNLHTVLSVTNTISNNVRVVCNPIIPSGYTNSAWQINLPSGTSLAPNNPGFIDLYAITSLDGTNYTNGDSGVLPPGQSYLCSFLLYPIANSAQVLHQVDVNLTPFKFRPIIENKTGVDIPSGTTISVSFYNRQVV